MPRHGRPRVRVTCPHEGCGFSWKTQQDATPKGHRCPQCQRWSDDGPAVTPRALPLGTVLDDPCPECDAEMVLRRSERFGLFYGCRRWPSCNATHGAHADGRPLGIPANAHTKWYRMAAHAVFDLLWKKGRMGRGEAYAWMAQRMGLTRDEAHVGRFNPEQCRTLIARVLDYFDAQAAEVHVVTVATSGPDATGTEITPQALADAADEYLQRGADDPWGLSHMRYDDWFEDEADSDDPDE